MWHNFKNEKKCAIKCHKIFMMKKNVTISNKNGNPCYTKAKTCSLKILDLRIQFFGEKAAWQLLLRYGFYFTVIKVFNPIRSETSGVQIK